MFPVLRTPYTVYTVYTSYREFLYNADKFSVQSVEWDAYDVGCWAKNGGYEWFELVNEFSHPICNKYILYFTQMPLFWKSAHIHSFSLHLQNNNTGNTRYSKWLNERAQLSTEKSYSEIWMRCELRIFSVSLQTHTKNNKTKKNCSKKNSKNGWTITPNRGWVNIEKLTTDRFHKWENHLTD